MKPIILSISFWLLSSLSLFAQQLPNYSFYKNNWLLLNPATFSENYLFNGNTNTLGLTGRYQWTGLENPPNTFGVSYQSVLEGMNIGIGGTLTHDQTGAISTTSFHGTFSYLIPLQKKRSKITQLLSFGLSAGMVHYQVDFSRITFTEPSLATMSMNNQTQQYPDFGIGLFYYADNKFYLGLSMPQLFDFSNQTSTTDGDFMIERRPHFYGLIGGYLPFGGNNPSFYLEPSIWVRHVSNTPLSVDGNLRLNYRNLFWIGAGYSLSNSLNAEIGYTFKDRFSIGDYLKIGLGYSFNASEYGVELGNTFELTASYAWGKSRRLVCPFE